MKAVENDNLIQGMLHEELERCRRMLLSLKKELTQLPKGSLHIREKLYKGKKYRYHYLKYRDGRKSISKHVSKKELDSLNEKLRARQDYEKEIKSYRARIKYLEKIPRVG